MNDQQSIMEIVEVLQWSGLDKQPLVAHAIDYGLKTGNWATLGDVLKKHPWILIMARNSINREGYQKAQNPFMPFPSEEEIARFLSAGELVLGYIDEKNNQLLIPYDTLCRPLINLGAPGGGKSTLAKFLLWQALTMQQSFNALIPDLKKEYRHLAAVTRNLKVIPSDRLSLNPLEVPSWQSPMDHLMAFAQVFVSENYLAGTSLNLLIELCQWLYQERGIFDGSQDYPTLMDLFRLISKRVGSTKSFRFTDILLWLQNRLKPYILHPCFNVRRGIPFEVFQKENLVLELDTGFTDNMYNFVVATIVNQLFMHNKAHNLTGAKLRHWINVDEARVLFQPNRDLSTFGESIINVLISKTRDLGIGFLVSSQEPASISQTLHSLASTKIAFPLTDGDDLERIQKSFGLTEEQTAHIFKLPPFGQAIISYSGFERPLLLGAPWFRLKRKLDDQELEERMGRFWLSLEAKIHQAAESGPEAVETSRSVEPAVVIPPDSAALLFFLSKYPFTKTAELTKAPGFGSPAQVNKARAWLVDNGYVAEESYRTSRTKPALYLVLQDKAKAYLKDDSLSGKGGFEHQLFQHVICEHLQGQGVQAKIEGRMGKSSKAVDVLGGSTKEGQVAYEVTLHFENLLANIHQDLAAGASEVVIVTRNRADLQKAMVLVAQDDSLAPHGEMISFRTIDEFPA